MNRVGFASANRENILRKMEAEQLDLLVIGGGITGAGIALDATVRGLSTGLIDMQDFAAGTSSRSTKLVHGGLRYLKQWHIQMVAEVGKERAIVYENAPHVTTPIWMMLPIYRGGTFGKWSTSMGLLAYDYLAKVKSVERRMMLSKDEALKKEPLLNKEGLMGAGYYVEYRTDDARLTLEVLKEAVERGALAVNYAKALRPLYEGNQMVGVEVHDERGGKTYRLMARTIVNATGPWVDFMREQDRSKDHKYLHLTKGVHLVFDGARFPLKEALYFDTPYSDRRMMFAIPRDGKTYVGTTDTHYTGDCVHPEVTEADISYVLDAVNAMLPEVHLTDRDIESTWAGLRPLIHEEGKDPSEISRKDEVFESASGLISIAGGKLTGYRKMAETIVDLVSARIQADTRRAFVKCSTRTVRLSGGFPNGSKEMAQEIQKLVHRGVALGISLEEATLLCSRYGSNVLHVYDIAEHLQSEFKAYEAPLALVASVIYSMNYEMAVTPEDFLMRRTGAKLFRVQWAHQWADTVKQIMDRKV